MAGKQFHGVLLAKRQDLILGDPRALEEATETRTDGAEQPDRVPVEPAPHEPDGRAARTIEPLQIVD